MSDFSFLLKFAYGYQLGGKIQQSTKAKWCLFGGFPASCLAGVFGN